MHTKWQNETDKQTKTEDNTTSQQPLGSLTAAKAKRFSSKCSNSIETLTASLCKLHSLFSNFYSKIAPQNIMYDRRIVRGNTFAALVIPVNMQPEQMSSEKQRRSVYPPVSVSDHHLNVYRRLSSSSKTTPSHSMLSHHHIENIARTTMKSCRTTRVKTMNTTSSPISLSTGHP